MVFEVKKKKNGFLNTKNGVAHAPHFYIQASCAVIRTPTVYVSRKDKQIVTDALQTVYGMLDLS